MNYANLFSPVTTELTTALIAILPIAVGVFGLILAIQLGARLVREFVGASDDEDEDE